VDTLLKPSGENERMEFVLNSLESNVVINMNDNKKKRILINMKFDGIEVCQNAWYKPYVFQEPPYFSYKMKFLNGDTKLVNGNCGLEKPRPDTLAIIARL
jgi:hypothetical protein